MAKTTYQSSRTRTLVAVGVFSAFAYVCCVLFHFKAGFLSFDLKDSVMAVGAMLFGPMYGLAMALIVALIEFVTISGTGVYGLIMNVLSSTVFVCVGSWIYSYRRTMGGALLGMGASVVGTTGVMMLANLLVTPYYMGVTVDDVIGMLPTVLLPFNLTKAIFNASLVFLLYKPVATALRRAGFVSLTQSKKKDGPEAIIGVIPGAEKKGGGSIRSMLITVSALVVAILALVYFFVGLSGSFEIGQ